MLFRFLLLFVHTRVEYALDCINTGISQLYAVSSCLECYSARFLEIKIPNLSRTHCLNYLLVFAPPPPLICTHITTQEMRLPLIRLAATEIVSGVSGESEGSLRDLFSLAKVVM
jgi:hypothetical protein